MLGAIIGDVAGSTYEKDEILAFKSKTKIPYEERIKILDKNVSLFKKDSIYTDDTCLTVAIADALLNDRNYELYLKEYGLKEHEKGLDLYGRSRFGSGFIEWLHNKGRSDSYGNGCAMRISSIPFYLDDLSEIRKEVCNATIPSHNCKESISCALAVSDAIYMAKNKCSKEEKKTYRK